MRIAYADPPYLGCCGLYDHRHDPPYGCWDDEWTHRHLMSHLAGADGFVLHLSAPSLPTILAMVEVREIDYRVMSWVRAPAAAPRQGKPGGPFREREKIAQLNY